MTRVDLRWNASNAVIVSAVYAAITCQVLTGLALGAEVFVISCAFDLLWELIPAGWTRLRRR